MSNRYFITQEATKEILLRVTNVCGECYSDLHQGEIIHYDMQHYRYICQKCQDNATLKRDETQARDISVESLF